jgi:glycosyltransferase
MKISIITVTKNNKAGLVRAIESVRSQTYKSVEHIIVDGGSTDGSVEAIKNEQLKTLPTGRQVYNLQFVSETDSGIYDAINKGIKLATGDVIGLLHSDDFFTDEFVLAKYAEAFGQSAERQANSEVQAVYSDLVYVMGKSKVKSQKSKNEYIDNSELKIERSVIRYWQAHKIKKNSFTTPYYLLPATHLLNGWMPPHPTLFVRKEIFDKYGLYRTDMKIAADYEMVLRLFWKHKITSHYLPITTYCMTIGGASNKSLRNILTKSSEDYRSMKMHSLPYPFYTLLCKNLRKLPQFFKS